LFLLKFASIAVEKNGKADSQEAKKWLISALRLRRRSAEATTLLAAT